MQFWQSRGDSSHPLRLGITPLLNPAYPSVTTVLGVKCPKITREEILERLACARYFARSLAQRKAREISKPCKNYADTSRSSTFSL